MKLNIRREASCLALALVVAGCGAFGGKSDEKASDGEGETSVTMQGSLALTGDDAAAALTADPYNLYCVTFTDVPTACKIEVSADGAFDHACSDYANKTFGCFLRQGTKTLATIEFDLGSALTVGGGSLVMNVNYDPETGMAFAKIDKEASSSMGGGESGGEKTSIALDGTWNIGCGEGDSEIGDCAGMLPEEGFDLTFTTFMVGEQAKAAMWESPAKRNVCIDGGTEALPNFRVAFGGKNYTMDYSSREKFEGKVDAMFTALAPAVKEQIVQFAGARGHYQHCQDQPSVDSCKLITPVMEEVKYPDPNSPTGMRTEMHPKFDYTLNEYAALTEYTGTLTENEWKCAIDHTMVTENIGPCPPDMKDADGDGYGTQVHYMAGDKPAMLLCQVGEGLMQMPVMADTKVAAVAAATGGSGSECEEIDYAGGKYYRTQVEEIRRAAYELFMVQSHGGPESSGDPASMCDRLSVPDNFTFALCSSGNEEQPYEICYMANEQMRLKEMGLKLSADGTKLVADGQPNWYNDRAGEFTCPVVAAEVKLAMSQPEADHNALMEAAKGDCRDELAAKSAVEQARALSKEQSLYRPLGESVICGRAESDPLRTQLLAALSNSCLAEVDYNKMCFEGGQCQTSMVCRGSSNGGKCYSKDGELFTGRINGRDDVMDLKMEVGGAFTMSSSAIEKYYSWNQESNQPVACTYARQFIINARKVDDNNFTGIVSEAGKQSCEGGEDSEGGDGGKDSEGGDGGKGGNFTIPITATRQ